MLKMYVDGSYPKTTKREGGSGSGVKRHSNNILVSGLISETG